MPAGYEYHLDHRVIDAAAWDHVTLVDMEHYLEQASQLPNDLRGAVEYLDLSEVLGHVLLDDGLRRLEIVEHHRAHGLLDVSKHRFVHHTG